MVNRVDLDELQGQVIRHDAEIRKFSNLPTLVQRLVDQVNRIEALVNGLEEWRSDSKVQYIHDLRGKVRLLEDRERAIREKAEKDDADARAEVARDRLDFHRSIRAAIVSAVVTMIAAYAAAKLGVHLP